MTVRSIVLVSLLGLALAACQESGSSSGPIAPPASQDPDLSSRDSVRATSGSILGRWALDTFVNVMGGIHIQDTLTFLADGTGRVDGWHSGEYHDIEAWNWSIVGDSLVRVTTRCWEGGSDGIVSEVECDGTDKGLVYIKAGSLHIQTYEGIWWDFRYRKL